ncbi:hypothetical protein SAMN05444165_2615 [Paraburkholderia phenazinium]|jgi:hypothetical protein|uniref:Uncharacterized protein n=1 Tax=Paraburkholderia phenazinium TaxID=60549 RepID=A0A1N6IYL2_9BURK|nr:hypothetical protein SAMN05444165_2615 [Paraburkholderia phenazinium]
MRNGGIPLREIAQFASPSAGRPRKRLGGNGEKICASAQPKIRVLADILVRLART